MLGRSLYVSVNIFVSFFFLSQRSSAVSVHLPVLVPALHGDEVRGDVLPPGLPAPQRSALLGQAYEHFFAIFSTLCRGVRVEVVF